ncbi:MAG: hypothetical protein H6Q19_1041 [Bacteroidetes bacterium]|nr:hypothetical protein [Bacteroidota bacterium]
MKYFIQNEQIDNTIKEIRKKVRLSMNGVVSDKMKENGIRYKQNFGVDILRLKQIAAGYDQNKDLAQRLWALQIRETMILATLLQPVDSFSPEMADEWLVLLTHPEIVEQCCMNLFAKLPYAAELCLRWAKSDMLWHQITAFNLGARIWKSIDDSQSDELVQRALEISDTAEFHLYKSIALMLSRLCRTNKELSDKIYEEISYMKNSDQPSKRYIFSEVSQEISFLNF